MERNSYLVSHAFRNYLRAALLCSAFTQLTVMIDAMIAGHFIGHDALTAINLALPLTTMVAALSSLIGLGPAIMAAKAIGSRNTEKINSIFSSAMYQAISIGLIQVIILYLFLPQVGRHLCPNEHLLPYLMEYLQVLPLTFCLIMVVSTLVSLIESDGHPGFVTKAIALGSLLNVVLDVVLVKFFSLGVQGLALAMLVNYLSVLLFFISKMRSKGVSYRWTRPRRKIIKVTIAGLKEGMPIMLNDLTYSLTVFCTNSLLLMYHGEEELYLWAIFLQIILVVMVIVDCAEGAILSIGSVLAGEDDIFGLRALVIRSWSMVGGIVMGLMVVICIIPNQVALLFCNSGEIPANWPMAVRTLSLMLIPYALTTFTRSVFQIIGNKIIGTIFSMGQLALIIAGLYLSSRWDSRLLWWVFPIASWSIFALQFLYLLIRRHKKHINGSPMIPSRSKKKYIDLSVDYNIESVTEAIQRVCSFLQKHKVNPVLEMEVNICCEELMRNIVLFQTYKTRSYMDLSIVIEEHRIYFVLKDSGRPFNPLMVNNTPEMLEEENIQLGLYLVNNVCNTLTHKYMYGLNIVFAEFDIRSEEA